MATTTFKNLRNNAKGTLDGAIAAGDATLLLQTGEGANFPAATFWATIFEDDVDVNEIVLVTVVSTDTLTITRGQQGTAANSWADNANVQLLATTSTFTDIHTAINNIETRLGNGTTDVTLSTGNFSHSMSGAAIADVWESYYGGASNVTWDRKISRGDSGTPVIVQNADAIVDRFYGHDGTAFRQFGEFRAYINGTPGATDMPGAFTWKVSADGSATPVTAFTIAQDLSAAFAGAVTMASTLNVTGAFTCQAGATIYNTLYVGSTGAANKAIVTRAGAGYRADWYLGGDGTALRWNLSKGSAAETGSDAGSPLDLNAYTDGGVFIDRVFRVTRAAGGSFTISRPVAIDSTNALTVGGNFSFNGAGTFGDASTDLITCTGRLLVRSVTDAGPMTATGGTQREIVYNTSNSKWYGCTVTHATAATWSALN